MKAPIRFRSLNYALLAPEGDHITRQICASGTFYEAPLLQALLDVASVGAYIDVGAHIGNHTVAFALAFPSTRVLAVEPDPVNFSYLARNTASLSKVTAVNMAVHDTMRTVSMVDPSPGNSGMKRIALAPVEEGGIPAAPLDDIIEEHLGTRADVALIKIDVEGSELPVLRSGSAVLSRCRPLLAVEAATDAALAAVTGQLAELGYVSTGKYNATPTYIFQGPRAARAPAPSVPPEGDAYKVALGTFVVIITAYNRPKRLLNLLEDLAKEADIGTRLTVRVFDDGSTESMEVPKAFCAQRSWEWSTGRHGGKPLFAHLYTRAMKSCAMDDDKALFVFLPDDVRLCRNFFQRASDEWRGIDDARKRALTLLVDRGRDNAPCWTAVKPKKVGSVVQTQWVDGLFLCDIRTLRDLNFSVATPPPGRWKRRPELSSGVGLDMSVRLHRMGRHLYRVADSLVVHVRGPSVMNWTRATPESMNAVRFVDGEARHELLATVDDPVAPAPTPAKKCPSVLRAAQAAPRTRSKGRRIEASFATIPSRASNLPKTVGSLLPQVDVLRVYLNGYKTVPACLRHDRIAVAQSQEHGDRGDAGKFWWADKCDGFQLTCDDDFIYPPDYAKVMVANFERMGGSSPVSLHGFVVAQDSKTFYGIARTEHWRTASKAFVPVNVLGTGCLIYHPDAVTITPDDFELPNMADIWFGLACQAQKIGCYTSPRPANWLTLLPTGTTIYDRRQKTDAICTKVMRRVWPWKLYA